MKVTFRRSREIRRRILPFAMSLVMILTINMTAYAADAPIITTQPASQAVEELLSLKLIIENVPLQVKNHSPLHERLLLSSLSNINPKLSQVPYKN